MSRPLLWLRSWWLSHDKWQVLGVVDPVVNSHLRIVIMTTTLLLYTHHIAASMLVFPCRNGVGDILVYFHVSPWLPCLYGAFVAPEPGFLQQVSLPWKKKKKKKKEMVSGQQCWCYWMHLLSVIFLFGWCLHFEVFFSWYCFLFIYRGAHIHTYTCLDKLSLSSLDLYLAGFLA